MSALDDYIAGGIPQGQREAMAELLELRCDLARYGGVLVEARRALAHYSSYGRYDYIADRALVAIQVGLSRVVRMKEHGNGPR